MDIIYIYILWGGGYMQFIYTKRANVIKSHKQCWLLELNVWLRRSDMICIVKTCAREDPVRYRQSVYITRDRARVHSIEQKSENMYYDYESHRQICTSEMGIKRSLCWCVPGWVICTHIYMEEIETWLLDLRAPRTCVDFGDNEIEPRGVIVRV